MAFSKKQLTAGIVLGLLGYAANLVKLELFFGVDFLFGSILVMLTMLLYGGAAGIIAGVIASLCTWYHWHHPWSILSFTGEALFVAWWLRTRSRDLIIPDILFWVCFGAPFLWLSYHNIMGMEVQPTLLVMLKQGINGIMNTLMATLVAQAIRSRSRDADELLSLQQLLSTTIMTFVLFPALIYLALETWSHLHQEEGRIVEATEHLAEESRGAVRHWLDDHYNNVITMANIAGDPATTPTRVLQQRLNVIKSSSHDFLRLAILDKDAVSIAVSSSGNNTEVYRNIDMSDRPYIKTLRDTKKPAIADLVAGRLGTPALILPLAAPILIDGELKGFCVGAVDPTILHTALQSLADSNDQQIALLDSAGRIIAGSRPGLKTQEQYVRPINWMSRPLAKGVTQWVPLRNQAPNAMQRWRFSRYVKEIPLGLNVPWTLYVETSPREMLADLSRQSITSFSLMLVLIISTVIFSRLAGNRLLRPLLRLQSVTIDLPRQIAQENSSISWPESSIREIHSLICNFRQMAVTLTRHLHEMSALNESLEVRIASRTASLQEKSTFLSALLDSLPDLVFFKDLNGSYLGTNSTLGKFYGRTQEKIVGATDYDFFSPEVARQLQGNDRTVLKTRAIRKFNESVILLDGRSFPTETVKAPLILPTGEIVGLVGVARDITDRVRHEQELILARTAAEAANLAKSQFLAAMSHELRTPLNAILGLSEIMQEGILGLVTPEQHKALATIEESGRHLLELITDILDIARIEAGRIDLEYTQVALDEICSASLRIVKVASLKKQITATFTLNQAPDIIWTDQRRLKQILINLLSNAVKFTPDGGSIGLEVAGDESQGEIRFTVWDTGIGIASDDHEKLFKPFVQVDSSLARRYEGTGLGLALVAGLSKTLGGTVAVTSEPGTGSRFTVTLPCEGKRDTPVV